MADILELTFENIDVQGLTKTIVRLNEVSQLSGYELQVESYERTIDFNSIDSVYRFLSDFPEGALVFNFIILNDENLQLPNVSMHLLRYEQKFDLNIQMNLDAFSKYSVIDLQNWATYLSEELRASTYYCGYEPAVDEETRFFTESNLGPLKFNG